MSSNTPLFTGIIKAGEKAGGFKTAEQLIREYQRAYTANDIEGVKRARLAILAYRGETQSEDATTEEFPPPRCENCGQIWMDHITLEERDEDGEPLRLCPTGFWKIGQ